METDQVQGLILEELGDAIVFAEGDGCSFSVCVISEAFNGKTAVARQQRVLTAVKEQLATGELHAMSVKAYTPDEWASLQAQNDHTSDGRTLTVL